MCNFGEVTDRHRDFVQCKDAKFRPGRNILGALPPPVRLLEVSSRNSLTFSTPILAKETVSREHFVKWFFRAHIYTRAINTGFNTKICIVDTFSTFG